MIIVAISFHDPVCISLYNHRYAGRFFPEEEDGPIYQKKPIYIPGEDEPKLALYLIKTLEKNWKNINQKYLLGRKYKVKYHARDLPIGGYITEHINNFIKECSRTIIILTPDFLKSHWCQHYFQIAYAANKIVVVEVELSPDQHTELKEELNKSHNKSIRNYLTSFQRKTFKRKSILKWSGSIDDKAFWRQLSYILPHQHHDIQPVDVTDETTDHVNHPLIRVVPHDTNKYIGYYPDLTIATAALKLYSMPHKTSGTFLLVRHLDEDEETKLLYHLIVLHETFGKPYSYEISKVLVGDETKLNLEKIDSRVHNNLVDLIEFYKIDSNSNLKLTQPYMERIS